MEKAAQQNTAKEDGKLLYSCFHYNLSRSVHRKNTLPMIFNGVWWLRLISTWFLKKKSEN